MKGTINSKENKSKLFLGLGFLLVLMIIMGVKNAVGNSNIQICWAESEDPNNGTPNVGNKSSIPHSLDGDSSPKPHTFFLSLIFLILLGLIYLVWKNNKNLTNNLSNISITLSNISNSQYNEHPIIRQISEGQKKLDQVLFEFAKEFLQNKREVTHKLKELENLLSSKVDNAVTMIQKTISPPYFNKQDSEINPSGFQSPSIQELCGFYNSVLNGRHSEDEFKRKYNPKEFKVNNMGERRQDSSIEPVFELSGGGDFWIIGSSSDKHWLIPKIGLSLDSIMYSAGGINYMFECRGYWEGYSYKQVKLEKPAVISKDYKRKEKGILLLGKPKRMVR